MKIWMEAFKYNAFHAAVGYPAMMLAYLLSKSLQSAFYLVLIDILLLRGYIPFMTNYEYTCSDCGVEAISKKAASRSY